MSAQMHTSSDGYSPPIAIELFLHGQRFDVASVGPDKAVVHNAPSMEAGIGIIRLTIDGHITNYKVNLTHGLDPLVTEQPLVLLGIQEEVAA